MQTIPVPAPADFDYDALLRAHLEQIFNERDPDRRSAALVKLYHANAEMLDPEGSYIGLKAISERIDELLASFPEDFSFRADGRGLGLGNVACLAWKLGAPAVEAAISGVDVVHLQDGRIKSVYVLIGADDQQSREG